MKKVFLLIVLMFLFEASSFCLGGEPIGITVSIGPQVECVQRIGGDRVHVTCLVPPGISPETFSPGPRELGALARSAIYVTIGLPFEAALVPKVAATFPKVNIVDGRKGMHFRRMEGGDHGHHHGHGGHECHEDEGLDPHVWLSWENMVRHSEVVENALREVLPKDDHPGLERRRMDYVLALQRVHEDLRQRLSPLRGRSAVVFHPAFGYFLDDYGLRQQAVEVEGKEPGGRHLAELIRKARADGVRVVFVQPQFNRKAAQVVASEIGGVVRVLDPLPAPYLDGLERLGATLLDAFQAKGVE